MPERRRRRPQLAEIAFALLIAVAPAPSAAFFIEEIISFRPGTNAGFGQNQMPDIVLGPPRGAGDTEGSFDVLALGHGGEIVVRLGAGGACDGPGPDFTIFENAFRAGGSQGALFIEVGIVAVSEDGVDFVTFPYDAATFAGLAGRTPVYAHPDNGIDPRDPSVSGGDPFDLADVGVERALFVRITDPGDAIPDPGNRVPPGDSAGFDLDAIAVVHACSSSSATPTPQSTATATATPSPSSTATPPAEFEPGDANGDGIVDDQDLLHIIAEIFDGDGDRTAEVGGGSLSSLPGVDANGDGIISAADLSAVALLMDAP